MARSDLVPQAFEWKQKLKVHFRVDIVLFDTIMHSNSTPWNFKRARLFVKLVQVSLVNSL